MNVEQRLLRLEKTFLAFASLVTGQAEAAASTPEEFTAFRIDMAQSMEAIAADVIGASEESVVQ
jgi:hypothetical protein